MSERLPAFITEAKDKPPFDDCGLCAGGMLADFATGGEHTPTRVQMREACGIPDRYGQPDPTWLRNVLQALRVHAPGHRFVGWHEPKAGEATGNELTWAEFVERLQNGAGAVLNGLYAVLPAHYRRHQPSYRDGHSLFVCWHAGGPWEMDPLNQERGYEGEPIGLAQLRAFALTYADHGRVAAIVSEEDGVIGAIKPAVEVCDLPQGARILAENRRDSWTIGTGGGHGVASFGTTNDGYRLVVVRHHGATQIALTKAATNIRTVDGCPELQAHIDAALKALQGA